MAPDARTKPTTLLRHDMERVVQQPTSRPTSYQNREATHYWLLTHHQHQAWRHMSTAEEGGGNGLSPT